MSAAATRKHTAPRNVPALARANIDHGVGSRQHEACERRRHKGHRTQHVDPRDRPGQGSQPQTPEADSQGRNRVGAGHEKQNRAEDVGPPDVPVGLHRGEVVQGSHERADVEEKRPRELRGRRQPVLVARPPGPGQGANTGVLALLVYFRHPWTLSLYQLAIRRRGEEDRSHEEGHGVRGRPYRVYVRGERTQGEAGSAEHEQPGYGIVETYRFYAHASSEAGTCCHGPTRTTPTAQATTPTFGVLRLSCSSHQ